MPKLNLLFIAPYPELASLAEHIALEYPNVSLVVHTGDLDEGLHQAIADYHTRFDAVISRGGTAQTLEDELNIPVITMEISLQEMLENLAIANPMKEKMAAVGFHVVFSNLEAIRAILPYQVDLYTVDFEDQIPHLLDAIARGNYTSVLCDTVSYAQACRRGLPCHFLTSNPDGIRHAIDIAVSICGFIEKERSANQLLWQAFRQLGTDLVIYDEGGQLAFSSIPGGTDGNGVLEYIADHRDAAEHSDRLVVRRGGNVFNIRARTLTVENGRYTIFTVKHSSIPAGHTGIDYLNAEEVSERCNRSAFARVGAETSLPHLIRRATESRSPLLFEGEVGSGKDQIARLAYLKGDYASRPLVQVNLDLINKRTWNYFIKSYRSPLFSEDITLYIRGLQALEEDEWRELLAVLHDSAFLGRNRLYVSCTTQTDGNRCEAANHFIEQLRCTVLIVPPLRAATDVGDRLQRYLANLAGQENEPTPVLEPEARVVAEQGTWPRNYFQLREVAERLYAVHGDQPITEMAMREALNLGKGATPQDVEVLDDDAPQQNSTRISVDSTRPLAEIERILAEAVVKHYEGNRTSAARSLGISRTTLWRLLSEE